MKNTLKAILHGTGLFIFVAICMTILSNIINGVFAFYYLPTFIISAIPVLPLAAKLSDDIHGNKIKNSIFSVYSDGKIMQNSLAHPTKFLSILSNKNKKDIFINEALEMFMQLEKTDTNGKDILYHTKSQSMTLYLLRMLDKKGYIKNLNYRKSGKMKLVFEKLFFGSKPNKDKEYQMYRISFNLTDKERKKDEILSLISNNDKQDTKVIKQEINDKEEIKNKELTIKELKEIREQILSDQAISEVKESGKTL